MARNPRRVRPLAAALATLMILLMLAATGFVIWLCVDMVRGPAAPEPGDRVSVPAQSLPTQIPTQVPATLPPITQPDPVPEHVVATATVASMGDLLMHKPVFDSCRADGGYDFSSIFKYAAPTIAAYDYSLANLETTFGGDDYVYQGNPAFNCPDELADAVADAGYDMLLTANNHAGDTMGPGILRTVELVRSKGLTALGSQLSGEEPRYAVADVNGIQIGMVCYTWAYSGNGSTFSLNGLNPVKDEGQMNYFTNNAPEKLYNELGPILEAMKADGAEATMVFLHWGAEYQTTENQAQRTMAQKLCDMGVDVIVGGHPHVVQPVALLESTVDPDHRTVCIYSLGNAVSNQRTGVSSLFPPGYTEDGALFTVTFEKYSDGKVYLAGADVIPTWVNMHSNNGSREYNILPLEDGSREQWQALYDLTDANLSAAEKSYSRTMGIVGEGLNQCRDYLEQAKADRERSYYDLAWNIPEAA